MNNQKAEELHKIENKKLKNKITIMYFVMTAWFLLMVGYVSLYAVGVK